MNTDIKNTVQLVDEQDNPVGEMEKMAAHRHPTLHRAISVFIFNSKGEWLLQQRADDKYHSQGLWTNACCTHPYIGETYEAAAHRRLKEEMGMQAALTPVFHFIYKAKIDEELTEYEYDQVFIATTDTLPQPNPEEVKDWKYIAFDDLKSDLDKHPEKYTAWFKLFFQKVAQNLPSSNT